MQNLRIEYLSTIDRWAILRERNGMVGYAAAPMFLRREDATQYAFQRFGIVI